MVRETPQKGEKGNFLVCDTQDKRDNDNDSNYVWSALEFTNEFHLSKTHCSRHSCCTQNANASPKPSPKSSLSLSLSLKNPNVGKVIEMALMPLCLGSALDGNAKLKLQL